MPQWESCFRPGTDEEHNCLDYIEGYNYKEPIENGINDGWGKPYNCYHCNISCSSCYWIYLDEVSTTNFIQCDD